MADIKANFRTQVFEVVRNIPVGKVATYGQIAAILGNPRGARQVGWMLADLGKEKDVPWWRVVDRFGHLSIGKRSSNAQEIQKVYLENEGVVVDSGYNVELGKYRWENRK
jgi:methylated-DNA-protein-cysteine methyltransferase-like protein